MHVVEVRFMVKAKYVVFIGNLCFNHKCKSLNPRNLKKGKGGRIRVKD
jgi:hypothetical protein